MIAIIQRTVQNSSDDLSDSWQSDSLANFWRFGLFNQNSFKASSLEVGMTISQ